MDFPPLGQNHSTSSLQKSVYSLWQKCVHISKPDNDFEISIIVDELHSILQFLKTRMPTSSTQSVQEIIYGSIFNNLLCFLAYNRDIHMGLGHRKLTYAMLTVWYEYFPEITKQMIHLFVQKNNQTFSFGSWRDIPEFCNYLKHYSLLGLDHPLIPFLVSFMNETLHSDWEHYKIHESCNTNVAKWVPRESSKKNRWLFDLLFLDWSKKHTHYFKHNNSRSSYFPSLLKAKTKYRKMVSSLTKVIMPIERILCAKQNEITFPPNITSKGLVKYWDVLFNQNQQFQEKHVHSVKHNVCANNLSYYIKNMDSMCFFNPRLPRSKQIYFPEHIGEYVKLAYRCVQHVGHYISQVPDCPRLSEQISVLNSKWDHMYKKWNKLDFVSDNTIPVVNVNVRSLHDKSLHNAIARACFIAQKSNIKRILFSAQVPIWINVQEASNFVHMIQIIFYALQHEILINNNLDYSLELLGEDNTFIPIVITENGYCMNIFSTYHYNFQDFFSIMDSPRYKNVQQLLD